MKTIVVPKLSYTATEATVVEWIKREGDAVAKGEPVVTVETEKATTELEAPVTGRLYRILVPIGTTVPLGEVIAVITEPGEPPPDIEVFFQRVAKIMGAPEVVESKPPEVVESKPPEIASTPAARRLAREYSVDLTWVKGSGPEGRVHREDVEEFIKEKTVVPITGFRKIMSDRLLLSLRTYVPVMVTWEVDMTALLELRKEFSSTWEKQGVQVTVTALILKALVEALKENPIFNSTVNKGTIIVDKRINIGVATAVAGESYLGDKLLVPVIHNADNKSLLTLAQDLGNLTRKAREGALTMDDMTGATITVSNIGPGAPAIVVTQIIPAPQSAILGCTSIIEKPVVFNGNIAVRSMMNICLTYDHRIIVPTHSFKFRKKMTELLQNPQTLLS